MAAAFAGAGIYFAFAVSIWAIKQMADDRWAQLMAWNDRWRNWREARADEKAEREAARAHPEVACWRWSLRYYVAKELLWLAYFVAHRSWSALVGVVVFLAYPAWRRLWRSRRALA